MQQVICIENGIIWYGNKERLVIGQKYSLDYIGSVIYIYRDGMKLGFCTQLECNKIFINIDELRDRQINEILT